jgi:hypothetical protein
MFIFGGPRPMTEKSLKIKYEQNASNCSGERKGHAHTHRRKAKAQTLAKCSSHAIICTSRQMVTKQSETCSVMKKMHIICAVVYS